MQLFRIIFSLGFFLPFAIADGAAVQASIQDIVADTISLNSTVASYNGEILKLLKILGSSTDLLKAIKSGTKTAEESAEFNFIEAITIAGETQTLGAAVQSSLSTIVSKKKVFQKRLLQPAILLTLKEQEKASDKFSAAVVAKVPADLQATAKQLVAPIKEAFAAAIAEYKTFP
jgi:hypothetical protein